nr:MAG TPA: hypothetical protein [Caudoviricetes sp.]
MFGAVETYFKSIRIDLSHRAMSQCGTKTL